MIGVTEEADDVVGQLLTGILGRWPASRINGCSMVAKIIRTTVAEAAKGGCEGLFRATAGAYIFVG